MKNEFGHDVVEEGNVVAFPQQPAAPADVNEFGHPVVEDSEHATKLITGRQIAPDKAAQSISLSDKTGTPAQVIKLDPEKWQQNHDLIQGLTVAERNPYVKDYINNVPLAASVSKGDWDKLNDFSKTLQRLRPASIGEALSTAWGAWHPDNPSDLQKVIAHGFIDPVVNIPKAIYENSSATARLGRMPTLEEQLEGGLKSGLGLFQAATAPAAIVLSPAQVALGYAISKTFPGVKNLEEGEEMAGWALMGIGSRRGTPAGAASAKRPGDMFSPEVEDFLSVNKGIKTRQEIADFIAKEQKPLDPRELQVENAKRTSEQLKDAIVRANETQTKEMSADALERFSEQHGDLGTVHIPAQTLLDLYRGQGKVPIKGDGLFGFVPGLAQKLQIGVDAGTEIAIPMSKYVANIDPEVHTQIKDFVRVHEEGTTLEEADQIKEDVKAQKEQEPETIVSAAVRTKDGQIYTGPNHAQALDAVSAAFKKSSIIDEIDTTNEGMGLFVTSTGRVVDRNEAHSIANKASQISPEGFERNIRSRTDDKSRLLAEDLQDALKPIPVKNKTGSEKHKAVIANTTIDAQGKVRKSLYLDPLFTQGSDIAITQPEFAKYSNLIDRANEIILQKAVDFAEKEVAKRQTAEWRSNESAIKSSVLGELHERPDIKLDRFLRTGSLRPDGGNKFPGDIPKLDRDWVEQIAGKGALSRYTREKDGADLQVMSDMFGFASKEDMVKQLVALTENRSKLGLEPKQYINDIAHTETAVRMEAEHGKLLDNIAIEASNIALADFNVDLLTQEWKMLAALAGRDPPLNKKEMTAWVADQFAKAEVGQVSYKTFERASHRAGREAEKALLAKAYDEAFAAKQTQMLNFLLAKEAKSLEIERRPGDKLLDKYAGNANLPRVDQRFTDQIHALMLQYGIRIRRTQENVEHNLEGKDLATFIAEQQGQGEMLVIPQLPLPGTATLKEFTVNQYRDFSTLIKNLDHVGKEVKLVEVGQKKEDRFQAVDQITKNLDVMEKKGFDPDKIGPISALRRAGRYIDSKLLKAETLINWIDLNDSLGAMTQSVHRPLIEGQYKIGFMLEKIAKRIKDLPSDRAWGKALNERTDNQELLDFETREPLKLTNENKISIALNYGNKGNRRVMLLGHHWTEGEVEAYLERTMSPMDWKVVKGIHGLFEPLAPLVEEVTRRRSGLAVPLVEPTPFLKSEGGYYPLVQNPRDVLLKAKQQTDLFDRTKFDPLPMAPALKQRTGSVYKLDFSLNRLHSILGQTTHAVFMQEPVINANKVLKDPLVREGIANAFGPEYIRMLDDWIRDIANNGGMNDDMWASWVSRNLRENVVTMLMGWKVSTALIHGGSAGAATLFELGKMHLQEKGPKSFVLAPAELIKNMRELGLGQFLPETTRRMFSSDTQMWGSIDEVMGKSQELPNRIRTLQKDFGFQLEKIFNKNIVDDAAQVRAVFQTYAMSMVSALDLLTATPVWKAAEAKALIEGHDQEDAIFIADKAVREAHGSASLVSRANIGRGELNKWLTIAYNGYWNHNYNKTRQTAMEVSGRSEEEGDPQFDGKMKAALLGGFITAMIIAPALVHHAIRGDEAETTEGAILGMMASQLGGQIPILNTLTYSIIHNRDPSVSPIEEVLRSAVNVARDLKAEEPRQPVKHLTKLLGYSTGLMSNQIIDLVSALQEVSEGDQNPETPGDWARLVIRGHAQPKESGR